MALLLNERRVSWRIQELAPRTLIKEVSDILYNEIKKREKQLDEQFETIENELNTLPEGKLIWSHTGQYVKWYLSDGKNKWYISKKERSFLEKMVRKKHLLLQHKHLSQEKKAIAAFLKYYNKDAFLEELQFVTSDEYKEYISVNFIPLSQELHEWQQAAYEKNMRYPEYLTNNTYSGEKVRSKSESLIASILYKKRIPYRYECLLQLDEIFLYPDFTIRHPVSGELYYWEHFGLMDDPNYRKKAFEKLQLYSSKGIIPTIHLITTFETKDNPLDMREVEKVIEHYFS